MGESSTLLPFYLPRFSGGAAPSIFPASRHIGQCEWLFHCMIESDAPISPEKMQCFSSDARGAIRVVADEGNQSLEEFESLAK